MIDTIKPHYIIIQPIKDKKAIYDDENEILISPPIDSLVNNEGYELMDHVFYLNSEYELKSYELLYEFAELTWILSDDFFEDDFDCLYIKFMDIKSDKPLFGLHIELDENKEFEFCTIDFSDNNLLDEDDCDGDCENCTRYYEEDDNNDDEISSSYYFGIIW